MSSRHLGADISMLIRYAVNLRREADAADALAATVDVGIPVDPRPPAKPLRARATEYRDVADAIIYVAGVAARRAPATLRDFDPEMIDLAFTAAIDAGVKCPNCRHTWHYTHCLEDGCRCFRRDKK